MELRQEIKDYLIYCQFQKKLDYKTVRAYRIDLNQFADFIEENGDTFSKEELLNYLYFMEKTEGIPDWNRRLVLRDIAVIEMLFSTGMRISELCNLQDKAFDRKNGVICIYGKGAKERYLQIGNTDVLKKMNEYRDVFKSKIEQHGYFFVNRYGQPLSEQSARRMLHKHTEAIFKNTNITPHMFRHSFATFLMEEDVNIRYIQKMLGHLSITTTQIYTYVTTEKEKEILRTKHPRNRMEIGNRGRNRKICNRGGTDNS